MMRAVEQHNLEVNHWKAGEHASFGRCLQPLLDTRHILFRHGPADHSVFEDEARARRQWLETEPDASELTGPAGLLLVRIIDLSRTSDRLSVGDLRRSDIRVDFELAFHPVDDDLEVQLAHSLDHGLAAFVINRDTE